MDLEKNVYVYSDKKQMAMWDSQGYALGAEAVEVKRGIAEHWQGLFEGIRIEEVPVETIEQRTPKDPLEQNNRGTAFQGLKKPKKKGD